MNTVLHAALMGLGSPCATGTNIVHATVGTGLTTASGILLMAPDPTMVTKIVAGVLALGAVIQNYFFHPDCNKIATTEIVNQAEKFVQQNLSVWLSLTPAQKTPEAQQAALMNFDNVWNQVLKACGTGQYGTAGTNCIGDRQQDACHYQVAPGSGCTSSEPACWVQNSDGTWSLSGNGPSGSGTACWNWFIGYRDPIANDPQVAANVAAAASSGTASPSAATTPANSLMGGAVLGIPTPLLLIGGGLLAALLLVEAS